MLGRNLFKPLPLRSCSTILEKDNHPGHNGNMSFQYHVI
jgi:hypothetical protein